MAGCEGGGLGVRWGYGRVCVGGGSDGVGFRQKLATGWKLMAWARSLDTVVVIPMELIPIEGKKSRAKP